MTPQEQLCEKMRVEQSAYCLSHSTTPNPRILRLTNYSRLNPVKWSESYE